VVAALVIGVSLCHLGTGPLLDVARPVLEAGQIHQAALLDPARGGRGGDVEDEVRRGPGGDGGGDRLLGALARRDLLRGDLLVRMVGVPGLDRGLAPGDLLLIVGQPDGDGAAGGSGLVGVAAVSTGGRGGEGRGEGHRGERASLDVHRLTPVGTVRVVARGGAAMLPRRTTVVWSARTSAGTSLASAASRARMAIAPRSTAPVATVVRGGER